MSTVLSHSFARPYSLAEALEQVKVAAVNGVRPTLLAGGTDWMVENHMPAPGKPPREVGAVIDISAVPELKTVERIVTQDGSITFRLGAGVTYATMRKHPELAREVPILASMARDVGAVQIQSRGTLGGNLATGSPAADGVPVLGSLGAVIRLESARAGERSVPIESFYTGYKSTVMALDEVIVGIDFNAPGPHWFWRKVGTRMAQSIAKVALAATAQIENGTIRDAHFGMASVGPTTALLPHVRAEFIGRKPSALDATAITAAMDKDISPLPDVRSSREYRLHVSSRLLAQFCAILQS